MSTKNTKNESITKSNEKAIENSFKVSDQELLKELNDFQIEELTKQVNKTARVYKKEYLNSLNQKSEKNKRNFARKETIRLSKYFLLQFKLKESKQTNEFTNAFKLIDNYVKNAFEDHSKWTNAQSNNINLNIADEDLKAKRKQKKADLQKVETACKLYLTLKK